MGVREQGPQQAQGHSVEPWPPCGLQELRQRATQLSPASAVNPGEIVPDRETSLPSAQPDRRGERRLMALLSATLSPSTRASHRLTSAGSQVKRVQVTVNLEVNIAGHRGRLGETRKPETRQRQDSNPPPLPLALLAHCLSVAGSSTAAKPRAAQLLTCFGCKQP